MQCPRCQSENPDTSSYCGSCAAPLTPADRTVGSLETLPSPAGIVSTGTVFAGKYRIEGRIGEGGMGVVYRARDIKLERPVALKFLPLHLASSAELKERFLVEARAAAALSHSNICVIHEVGESEGQSYIAMEYVEGETLRQRMKSGGLTTGAILDIAIQIAAGLGEAHRKGVIHRDIKSANIMVTPDGQAKIMDFGLAKLQTGPALTRTHAAMGTVPYMSPEQACGEHVDQRTDIWSLGVVLYEMLAGDLPFKGETDQSVIHSIVNEEPRPLKAIEPPPPEELRRVVARALRKKAPARYASAEEMLSDLRAYQSSLQLEQAGRLSVSALWRRLRRPRIAVPALAAILALVASGGLSLRHGQRVRWAREVALPEIERIVSQNWRDFDEAYALAERAEEVIPHDPKLAELFSRCSSRIAVRTEPAGARVFVKPYSSPDAEWRSLGVSPLEEVRLPVGVFRWKLEKEGYDTVLAAASNVDQQLEPHVRFVPADLVRVLDRAGSVPEGMVRVPGGKTSRGDLERFFIDRYEVTNARYKAFVDAGGYADRSYWRHPFVADGSQLTWDEGVARLVDRTGRPGPATWEAGGYPEGEDDYPVSGVSWYEAAAYADWAGKSLPTVVHWWLATGSETPLLRLPWVFGAGVVAPFCNLNKSHGPVPVGSLHGMTSYGTFDMAGNVREWCWNETSEGRLTRGGSWADNAYMFRLIGQAPPMDRSPRNGFRCALYPEPDEVPAKAFAPVVVYEDPARAEKEPVSDEVFQVYKEQFAYDKTELNPRVEAQRKTPEWTQEKITFDAAYGGERVIAWLFLPANARPPYQTVIYFPGSAAVLERSSEHIEDRFDFPGYLSFILRNRRAVLYPVYKGTFERGDERLTALLLGDWSSRRYRDLFVEEVEDLSRCIDYLETRPDIDATKLAYFGVSWGGVLGAVVPAVEERFGASVLIGAGLVRTSLPETDALNYVTRVKVPTLMVNGRYDTIHRRDVEQKRMFDLLGTSEKKWALDETDHTPTTIFYVRETLAWLDSHLGEAR